MLQMTFKRIPNEEEVLIDDKFCAKVNCPRWNVQKTQKHYEGKNFIFNNGAMKSYRFKFKHGFIAAIYYSFKNKDLRCTMDMAACVRVTELSFRESILVRRILDAAEEIK